MIPAHWKMREWLTLSDAAQYLSSAIGKRSESAQRMGEADLLRFALDGYLKLSVDLPTGTKGLFHRDGANVTTRPTSRERIEGLWDLVMEGGGKQQVEHDYHDRAHLPSIRVEGITGAWVERDGMRRQLTPVRGRIGMSPKPSSALSEGSFFVVRIAALDALAEQVPPASEAEGNAAATEPATAEGGIRPETPSGASDASMAHQRSPTKASQKRNIGKRGGPRLATWLKDRMESRDHMTVNRLHDLTDLDHQTIEKILNGQLVVEVSLKKLAKGLSIALSDIPTD